MALRFVEGFDHCVTADLPKKWNVTGAPAISAGNGRRSTASLRGVSGNYVHRAFDNQQTWIVGFAIRMSTLPAGETCILRLLDSTQVQTDIWVTPTGFFRPYRGSATLLGTSSLAMTAAVFHYIEVRMLIGASGQVEIRLNGAVALNLTGVGTQGTVNAYANAVAVGLSGGSGPTTNDVDDVYICDGTGSAPHNTFLGDCRVDTLLPTSDGTSQQWTPSTPGTHYTLVDEAAPNTTDYVSSSAIGQRETYGMQDLATLPATIYGVQLGLAALKTDAGARSLRPLLLSGASEALGAATALSTSQTYALHVQATDPATGVAWSEAAVNAVQCGAEVA